MNESLDAYARLDHYLAAQRQAEVGVKQTIAELVANYPEPTNVLVPGAEIMSQIGLDGTSPVGEFLILEVAVRMGIAEESAAALVSSVVNVSQRHPEAWRRFLAGKLLWWQAAEVAHRCRELSFEQVQHVDSKLAQLDPDSNWQTISRNVTRWVAVADPGLKRRALLRAKAWRGVRVSGIEDGNVCFDARVAASDGIAFDQVLNQVADTLPDLEPIVDPITGEVLDTDDRQRKRAAALGVIARSAFGQDALPTHTLVVHIDARDVIGGSASSNQESRDEAGVCCPGGGVATVEKWGDLLVSELPSFLAQSKVVVRPIIDPERISPSDAYQIPEVMRFATCSRNPADAFPFSRKPARSCDLDHTIPYQPGVTGQTRLDNLAPISRRAHRAKTHGGWQLSQPQAGVLCWQTPTGARFLVTPTGTKRLDEPRAALLE